MRSGKVGSCKINFRLLTIKCPKRLGKANSLFHVSCLVDLHVAVIIYYSLLANATHAQQIYSATAIKSGRVMLWEAVMTFEAAGLK